MNKKANHPYTLGIDISKKTLDLCLAYHNKPIYQGKVNNTACGLIELQKKLKSLKINLKETLFCCENTGIYNSPLLVFTQKNHLNLWIETPLTIKKSIGFARGKSDKADAQRIANYAYRYQDQCRLWAPPQKGIAQLQKLWNHRKNILKSQTQIKQNLTEIKTMQGKAAYKEAHAYYKNILCEIEKSLKKVEKAIKETLASDSYLQNIQQVITSVDGVGDVTAIYLMVVTNGFKTLNDPRKLACYAGLAPFPYTSGTSVKGREKVSPFANKELKKLLHLCAVSLLKMENTFSDFIERKKKQGKHIMSILNAVRNKILHTICACVRKNEKYEKNYTNALA